MDPVFCCGWPNAEVAAGCAGCPNAPVVEFPPPKTLFPAGAGVVFAPNAPPPPKAFPVLVAPKAPVVG